MKLNVSRKRGELAGQDISRKTLAVLVFLVILVTVFSTWAVLTATQPNTHGPGSSKGMILLQIAGDSPKASSQPSTGNVALEISQ